MQIGFIGLGKMGYDMVQRLLSLQHEVVVWNIDPAPVITNSLFSRFQSRQQESFVMKVPAALRNQFGGHAVKSKN